MANDLETHKGIVSEFDKIWNEQDTKWKALFDHPMITTGDFRYWNDREHIRFLVCIDFLNAKKCRGLPVQQISAYVLTRNPTQVRTHAQKFFKTPKPTKPEIRRKVDILLSKDGAILRNLFVENKTRSNDQVL
ncbi:hypothetical protein EIN_469690 [Entamoeba invadens IP1]|uniref:HTH myb-type domain-containing protein n=1 Tax=Entamoeba invadens IP1 TaxID=370355 RepID=A0A0A1TUL6_ENTIV|nr:hypothetical protein EIN_469690 [Entamoeba invadens IP1]ELP83755.1 hypothetical protein EIN_469690 [Entamoeba invadens IP1]|eukprot:XP_004183101.1 hypothetical protein EIN_469690 [Entamoeba invadens IP1]